ncbi:MAG: tRNA preQ1(34) S-adenosylmethionine ribosyltransferase-isomerase QueA [Bacteroidales bacterium]|nr:tRNA preQ1(34) S-adenosylmethionine ribosyltransferase-isomerase QueA [Bacteroidales bacterium]
MHDLFFDYELPASRIAQQPAEPRDTARLLVLDRQSDTIRHRTFRDLPELLTSGDRLILNDTKVLPARLFGRRVATGGKWEALFLRATADGLWEMLAQTRGYPQIGEAFAVEPGPFTLTLVGRTPDRHWLMRPELPGLPVDLLTRFGQIPLPPYIRRGRAELPDQARYQTVFASHPGSVAAPTAGLHFTPALLERLHAAGIGTSTVTLHVGLGTFASVKADDPTQHVIHTEWCEVGTDTIAEIQATQARGHRVIAVGTTTTRTLETAARPDGLRPFRGESQLFIHPPYRFAVPDAIITNFHLPRTTLLLLVQAFAGTERLRRAYTEAIHQEYRFYSYGDAMLIL